MKSRKGFTLIEIMIVVFIISVIMMMVAVNPRAFMNSSSQARNFTREMVLRLRFAKQFAITTQTTIGAKIEPSVWGFYLLNQEGWDILDSPPPLKEKHPPRNISLKVNIENSKGPQILFYGSGDITPFVLECYLDRDNKPYRIIGHANGEIQLENSTI